MSEDSAARPRKLIPVCEPYLGGNEALYLGQCIETNFVSSVGPFVDRFEREFANFVGVKHAVAACNGTAALHVALRLAGVSPGDEVLVSTFTFIASVNPIKYLGGIPIFIDSDEQSWNINAHLVAEAIEQRARRGKPPKAIIAVHILGQPVDLEPILRVAAEYEIPVIEDAAESLGATYNGHQVGTLAPFGCYSFNGNKVMTTGGGGMIVMKDPALAKQAKHLTTQARVPGPEYIHDEIGYNYRLTGLQAALGVAQLEQLPSFLDRKLEIARLYDAAFQGLAGVVRPALVSGGTSSHWMYSLLVDPIRFGHHRQWLAEYLRDRGIQTRSLWVPIHLMKMYQECPRFGGEVAEKLYHQGLSLPCSVHLRDEDQEHVIASIRSAAQGSRG